MLRPADMGSDRAAIEELLSKVEAAGGRAPLSEEPRLDLEGEPARPGLVALVAGDLVGYAHLLDTASGVVAEVAVLPDHRPSVLPTLVAAVAEEAGPQTIRLWAEDEIGAEAARSVGMRPSRVVVRMECGLPAPAGTGSAVAEARIVAFRRDVDEHAYLIVSNEAFAGHPDSGGWDLAVLRERMGRSWFDPAGVFIAWERGRPVGLCWTKLHPGSIGEIYSVAVRPDAGGRGLGRALVVTGLQHLNRRRGARTGMVYTEDTNAAALGLYRSLGFRVVSARREFIRGG